MATLNIFPLSLSIIVCVAIIISVVRSGLRGPVTKIAMVTFSASVAYLLLITDQFLSQASGVHSQYTQVAWAWNEVFWKGTLCWYGWLQISNKSNASA